jgi:gliding motility-associated lipoprotein GldD
MVIVAVACREPTIPRPRGFFRIDLPSHTYRLADFNGCPFRSEIPVYTELLPDTNPLSEACWWYLVFPRFNATLYLSYKPIKNNLYDYIEDAHTLAYSHTIKAHEINHRKIQVGKNGGLLYEIGGNAASPIQFYITDSIKHFLRGSFYYHAPPNADSTAPVTRFIQKDIEHLLHHLQWK